jgi:glycerol-3-phosphate dehydrogenase
MNREAFLAELQSRSRPFDFVVIGGGATGTGIAVDAASRGLDVLLVEARDFAKGTSSRSSKLVHGGVRYLAQGHIGLVREALRERARLYRNAPHLVRILSIVVPTISWVESCKYAIGLKLYDLLSESQSFGASEYMNAATLTQQIPQLAQAGIAGGIRYFDGQFDDTRTVVTLVRTAVDHGAIALNYLPAVAFIKDAGARITGVRVRDEETGEQIDVAARVVVNATGPFADDVLKLDRADATSVITPSQGAHIVVDKSFLPGDDGVLIPKTPDGRIMFALPWHGKVVIGTTDTSMQNVPVDPTPLPKEIDMILEVAGRYLAKSPQREDLRAVFAGIRPLKRAATGTATSKVSREHSIQVETSGLVSIAGGKWTTYRRMAEDCVDFALQTHGISARQCRTAELALHGAAEVDHADTLCVYGSDAAELRALCEEDTDLISPLHPELPYIGAECIWAARHEMARNVEDVLARRTRALFLNAAAAREAAPRVAELLARELGRDENWQAAQLAAFETVARTFSGELERQ